MDKGTLSYKKLKEIMYTALQRANAILAFTISTCFAIIGFISVLTLLLMTRLPSANQSALKLNVNDVQLSFGAFDYAYFNQQRKEYAFFDLELSAGGFLLHMERDLRQMVERIEDLSPLFHWNTKELFVYIQMEYDNKRHINNQMILWDQIILEDPKEAVYMRERISNEYPLSDIDLALKSKNVTLAMMWEVIPYFGFMQTMRSVNTLNMDMPSKYSTRK